MPRLVRLLLLYLLCGFVAPAAMSTASGSWCACCDEHQAHDPSPDEDCCADDLGACCAAPVCVVPERLPKLQVPRLTAMSRLILPGTARPLPRSCSPPPLPPPIG